MNKEKLFQELKAYKSASETLNEWIAGTWAFALLRTSVASGIFDAARIPSTVSRIAAVTDVDERRVEDICGALNAHGIFDRDGEEYRLSHDFAMLASVDAIQSLSNTLDAAAVMEHAIAAVVSSDVVYTSLPSKDMQAIAKGEGANPSSAVWLANVAQLVDAMPEVKATWEVGGRIADLGCGTGGFLLSILVLYPRVTGVGVEIDAGTLAETRRRAVEVGVIDRTELRQIDARDLPEESIFDTVFWSQVYFPSMSRAATLEVALRAIKPGGHLIVPMFRDPPLSAAELRETSGRTHTLFQLVFGSWGITTLSARQLRTEVEGAGFEFLHVVSGSPNLMVLKRPKE